jgi:hypothetical protein
MTAASLDMRTDDTEALLHGVSQLGNAMVAPLAVAEQAVALADVISRTGLDPWDGHVTAIADAAICPILTLDPGKWRQHVNDLDERLHIIEISDPDDG